MGFSVWGGSSAAAERHVHMADRRVDDPEVLPAEDEVMSAVPTNLLLPGRRDRRLSGTGSFVSARGWR